MKEKKVVEENEEEDEGISKFCHILTSSHPDTQTNTVQFENREPPPGRSVAGCPLQGRGAWFNINLQQVKGARGHSF